MATYTEKLWGSSSGTYPTSVLTKRFLTTNETAVQCIADTDGEGGYLFEQEWSAAARRLNSWDTLDSVSADTELLCRFRLEGTTRADFELGLWLRGSGASTTETGYVVWLVETTTNDLELQIREYNSGTVSTLASSGTLFTDWGTGWGWLRFRANGSDLKAKLWVDGRGEPTAWSLETTDSTITAAGWNGIAGYAANTRTDIDYLSAGTAGDTAPITASTSTTIRTTAVKANALVKDDTTAIRTTAVKANVLVKDDTTAIRTTAVKVNVLYASVPPYIVSQQVAELAVQQSLASVEARSTQQIVEVLQKIDPLFVYITKQTAEVAVQNSVSVYARNTQQIVEVLMLPPVNEDAYDNFDSQPISVMF